MVRIAVLLFAGTLAVNAQTTTGTLFGVARDTSGGVIPGVAITATQAETSLARKTVTDHNGEFLITNLPWDRIRWPRRRPASAASCRRGFAWR